MRLIIQIDNVLFKGFLPFATILTRALPLYPCYFFWVEPLREVGGSRLYRHYSIILFFSPNLLLVFINKFYLNAIPGEPREQHLGEVRQGTLELKLNISNHRYFSVNLSKYLNWKLSNFLKFLFFHD